MNRELDLQAKSIHEAIEARTKAEGLKPKPVKPLEYPVVARAHSAIYKMHRYYARRPQEVFARLIGHYTDPGDLILDPFCGGGVTVVEGLRLRRRVVGIDLNPLATWVTQVEVELTNLDQFQELYEKWFKLVRTKVSPLFATECAKCHGRAQADWYEWSNVIMCPHCDTEVILSKAKKPKKGVFQCTNAKCHAALEPSRCQILDERMVSVTVNCAKCHKTTTREPLLADIKRFTAIRNGLKQAVKREKLAIPTEAFPDMDRARDDNVFGKGISHFRQFMTERQLLACARMKKSLPSGALRTPEVNALWHLFSSSLRYTNKFVFQSAGWQGGNPIEWAGHNYWLPFHFIELNGPPPV